MRGKWWSMPIRLFWRLTKTEGEAAIALLRKAVERYPDYAPAHSMLAFALLVSRLLGWTLVAPQVKEAAALATRAAELDDSDPWAHLALGYVAHIMRRTEDAATGIPARHRSQPKFRRCPWLFRVYTDDGGPIRPSDCVFGTGHPHESARSAKCDFQ